MYIVVDSLSALLGGLKRSVNMSCSTPVDLLDPTHYSDLALVGLVRYPLHEPGLNNILHILTGFLFLNLGCSTNS